MPAEPQTLKAEPKAGPPPEKSFSDFLKDTGMPSPEAYEKKGADLLKESQTARKPLEEKQETNIAKMFDLAKQLQAKSAPAEPKLQDLPEAPDSEYRDPMQSLGSLASALAMFASLKTRAPLTSALNAASASMQGFHQGDQERVKLERGKWRDNLEAAIKQNQVEMNKYEVALKGANFDLAKARPMFEAIAAENDHTQMLVAAQQGDYKMMHQIMDGANRSREKLADMYIKDQEKRLQIKMHEENLASARADRVSARNVAHQDRMIALDARLGTNFSGVKGGTPGAAATQKPLDEVEQRALELQAWNFINTKTLPYRKGTGGALDRNKAITEEAARISMRLGMTPEELSRQSAEFKSNAQSLAFQAKKMDAISAQLESFHNNIDTWESIASGVAPKLGGQRVKEFAPMLEKINFVGIRSVDDVKLKIQQEFNDPSVSALMVSAMAVAMDYARIMQGPQSIASLTEGARKDAERLVAASADEKGRAGIKAALESDAAGQVKGLETQLEETRKRMTIGGRRASDAKPGASEPAPTNAKGWKLYTDKSGNKAYVSPDRTQFEEVK